MRRRNTEDSVFSLSALDLFASAMGAFMILALVMIPYYQNKPQEELEADIEELNEKLAQAVSEQSRLQREVGQLSRENRNLQGAKELAEELEKQMGESVQFSPLEVVVMMDVSITMEAAVDGIKSDIGALVEVFSRVSPELTFGVVGYRDVQFGIPPRKVLNPSQDGGRSIKVLQSEVDKLKAENGKAYVEEAIAMGINYIESSRNAKSVKVLVLLGDAAPVERGPTLLREPSDERYIAKAFDLVERWMASSDKNRFTSIFFRPPPGPFYTDPTGIRRREEGESFFREIARRAGARGKHSENSGSMFSDILDAVLGG